MEIMSEGTSQSLNQLVEWAKEGPPAAEVKQVDLDYESASGEFAEFLIER